MIPASCWTIIAGIWPVNAFGVSVHLTPFASAAAEASGDQGGAAAARLTATRRSSSGAATARPCDIGFSGVSAAAERNEDIIYVLNDNEAYMNTGVQKSGATPEGAWTTTTPAARAASGPEEGHRPDHGRARDPVRRDARRRVGADAARLPGEGDARGRDRGLPLPARARRVPAGLAIPDRPVDRGRAPGRRVALLPALSNATTASWRITFRPKHPVPVREFLATQGRFGHLRAEQVEAIQAHVDERWEALVAVSH